MKKTLITISIIASLVITSTTVFAAVNTSVCKKQSISKATVSTTIKNTGEGNIEYAKKTMFNADGNIAAVEETWADPVTHDERIDYLESVKGSTSLSRVAGAYVLENDTKYIKMGTDDQGNLLGWDFKAFPVSSAKSMIVGEKQEYVNQYKEGTRRAGWSDKGIVQAIDGNELIELSRSDNSVMPGEIGKTCIENVYVDKRSGLPVKGDISIKKNGTTELLYTYIYEFKNVGNDGSLFNTKGMNIQEASTRKTK